MDALLKPMMKLLPKKKDKSEKSKKKEGEKSKEPAPNLHHLLYAMKNLNPKFIAVASEVAVVPWNGATQRPAIDAYLTAMRAEETRMRLAEEEKERKAEEEREAQEKLQHAEEIQDATELEKEKLVAERAAEKAAKKKKKAEEEAKKKILPSFGCCITDKGTLSFIGPNGLVMLDASVNRRNMRLIEVKKMRHCVDSEFDGMPVTVVWSFVDNSAQTGDKAKAKFREVAARVLPDVEYREIFDSESDDEKPLGEEPREGTVDATGSLIDATPQPVDDGKPKTKRPPPETLEPAFVSDSDIDSPPTEEEQLVGDPDEAPFDLSPAVERLQKVRTLAQHLHQRKRAAQRWLAEHEASEAELRRTTAEREEEAAEEDRDHVSDREKVLRLALLVNVICDRQRALRASLAIPMI